MMIKVRPGATGRMDRGAALSRGVLGAVVVVIVLPAMKPTAVMQMTITTSHSR
jgi:hypothetical protein